MIKFPSYGGLCARSLKYAQCCYSPGQAPERAGLGPVVGAPRKCRKWGAPVPEGPVARSPGAERGALVGIALVARGVPIVLGGPYFICTCPLTTERSRRGNASIGVTSRLRRLSPRITHAPE